MKSNDIAVDFIALDRARNFLRSNGNDLKNLADALAHNVRIAEKDFNSVTYQRAKVVIADALNKVHDICDAMDKARKYVDELEHKAQNYLDCKYRS